ncbi:MAG: M23 family metallopeptidase [Terricaulis sp.]
MKRLVIAAAAFAALTSVAGAAGALFPSAVVHDPAASIAERFGMVSQTETHSGTDVAAPAGTLVFSPASGRVMAVYAPSGLRGYYGQVVEIDHGAAGRTRFADLTMVPLKAGDEILAGVPLGRVAQQDAPHVHVELWRDGVMYDPQHEMTLIGRP